MFCEELKKLFKIDKPLPFNSRQREIIYAAAYAFYQGNEFAKAADIFTLLICYNPFDDRFWKGLASCRQMEKNYEAALKAWAVFCALSDERKVGFYHVSQCFLSKGRLVDAERALKLGATT